MNDKVVTKRSAGADSKPGDKCGLVRGKGAPCPLVLDKDGRCPKHCRHTTRNEESVGVLCSQYRMVGRRGCSRHGGKTRVGALNPAYTTGRFSRFAPTRYAKLAKAVSAGDPLDLSDDINVVGARIAELMQGLDAEGGSKFTERSRKLLESLYIEVEPSLTEKGAALYGQLRALYEVASRDWSSWSDIQSMFAQRLKMVESERKRALEGHKYVTAEEVVNMFKDMANSLKEVLERTVDKTTADQILTDVNRHWAAQQGVDSDTTELGDVG